jgi:uncharacterized protein YdeI (YjbR/CyaY-like superfamily)
VSTPRAFRGPGEFRSWLAKEKARTTELLVRCFKTHAAGDGLTYRQALDEALCFGWIDGVRRSVDDRSFSVRFSPRKAKSKWSTVNIKRMRELLAAGRVRPPGKAAFDVRVKSRYSFESRPQGLPPSFRKAFQARPRAWRFFEAQPRWYRRTSAFWVMSAKKPETRDRRFGALVADSEAGRCVGPLRRPAGSQSKKG